MSRGWVVLDDLEAEHADLDGVVTDLDDRAWETPTPSAPWTVRDQIGHLAFFDEKATLAAEDPAGFAEDVSAAVTAGIDSYMSAHIERGRSLPTSDLLEWWHGARERLVSAFRRHDPDDRLPWYGPPMRARTSAAARLMETWAHGQDVVDALGIRRRPSDRVLWVAELGVKTFSFSFANRGLEVPERRVRVTLRLPSGRVETWNPGESDSIVGPAEDFCLVVAQRRDVGDTDLVVEGKTARSWMAVAQVFAGMATVTDPTRRGMDV